MIARAESVLSARPRRGAGRAAVRVLALLVLSLSAAAVARAGINVTPVTWNIIGLDSNNVNQGPNTFQVGARACNTGPGVLTNLRADFVWDSTNTFINLGGPATIMVQSLAAGSCTDFYFQVVVTRNTAARDTARRYHITISADGVAGVSTPTPRELYVEKLISQGRNQVDSITGPTSVFVGQTYQYTMNSSTAPGGYPQFEAFLNLSNVVYQVLSIQTTYTSPAGGTNDKFYADACGWQDNPTLPNYRNCVGPEQYLGGKAGGTVSTTYTVKILSGSGSTTAGSLILDFSGSSFHYDSGIGITVNVLPPPLTLSKLANPTTAMVGTNVAYTLRLTNTGASAFTVTDFVDTLPTAPAQPAYVSGSSAFNGAAIGNPVASGATLTWAGSFIVPAGATRNLTYTLTMPSTAGSYVNSAVAHIDYTQIDSTASTTDNAPAAATVAVVPPPNVALSKSCTAPANCTTQDQPPGTDLTFQIAFTSNGGMAARNFALTDPVPTNTDFKVGSAAANLGTTGLTVTLHYSYDGGVNFTTTAPTSGGGGAPAGYDRTVTHVRWVFAGVLSQVAPDNAGSVQFATRIR